MIRSSLKDKIKLHPVMSFILLVVATIVLSGILGYFDVGSTYLKANPVTETYETVSVNVDSLFNLAGIKYVFSKTVTNFVNFAPLSMLIITLLGIGIMEKSGFLQAFFTLITKFSNKNRVTFFLIFTSIVATICGEVIVVMMLPIAALLFKYGRRNPAGGIIASFAGITSGIGANILLNSVDTSLIEFTEVSASLLDKNYSIGVFSFLFISIAAVFLLSFALTIVTEKYVIPRLDKYEPEEGLEEYTLGKRELRGLVIGLGMGVIYLLFFAYNIIPGLPLSGNLLDYSQTLYIDKLFGYNSFFSSGFIFVITMLFVILGLFYGIGAKTIKNNKNFSDFLSHSLNKSGKILVLIFTASVFISVFKRTYLGNVIAASLVNIIVNSNFGGIILVFVFFLISAIATIFLPQTVLRWSIFSGISTRVFMDAGMTPEFAQLIFRAGESVALGLTPLFAYFIVYLGFLKQYNHEDKTMTISDGIKYMIPYSVVTAIIWLILIIIWYTIGIPLGFAASPFM